MSKKNNYKKHLIRNTELSVPETEVTKSAPPPTPIEEVEKNLIKQYRADLLPPNHIQH